MVGDVAIVSSILASNTTGLLTDRNVAAIVDYVEPNRRPGDIRKI